MGPRFFKRGEWTRAPCWPPSSNKLQWGHASSSVESQVPQVPKSPNVPASMGPRFFKRGERTLAEIRRLKEELQWGHASSSVERSLIGLERPGRRWASMGPRFFKRGEVTTAIPTTCGRTCFNGATLLQAWRDRTRNRRDIGVGGFNGATLLQAWRGDSGGEEQDRSVDASM